MQGIQLTYLVTQKWECRCEIDTSFIVKRADIIFN